MEERDGCGSRGGQKGTLMIEVSGIRVPLRRLDGDERHELGAVRTATLRKLHLSPADISSFELRRRSVDARKKSDIVLTYSVWVELAGRANAERQLLSRLERRHEARGVSHVDRTAHRLPPARGLAPDLRPIVVGAGCAGLFCALALAEAGLAPLLVERGDDATRRTAAVAHLNETGVLDPESNIQFGLGGAGTFSDGKLGTGTTTASSSRPSSRPVRHATSCGTQSPTWAATFSQRWSRTSFDA